MSLYYLNRPVPPARNGRRDARSEFCISLLVLLALLVMGASAQEPGAAISGDAGPDALSGRLPIDPALLHYLRATEDGSAIYPPYPEASAAYRWITILQDVTATDVEEVTRLARPTIIARQMAIATTAMYEAWAAYDDKAVGTRLGAKLRQPKEQRTKANKEEAIAYAMQRAMLYAFPQPTLQQAKCQSRPQPQPLQGWCPKPALPLPPLRLPLLPRPAAG